MNLKFCLTLLPLLLRPSLASADAGGQLQRRLVATLPKSNLITRQDGVQDLFKDRHVLHFAECMWSPLSRLGPKD